MNKTSLSVILSMSFVVTGNMLGAGILALPIKTGLSGAVPSFVGIVVMWACMLTTACILASQKSLTQSETADLPTFFQHELGSAGKWVTVVANMIILYGLLVAYISGAADVLQSLFAEEVPQDALMVSFFVIATFLTLFGMALMQKGNAVIMILMWLTFGGLVIMAAKNMDTTRLTYTDWHYLPASLPIVVTAFHFHNIIPSICRTMNYDQKAIRTSFFLGTFIGLIMNLIWVVVVIAALPLDGPDQNTILNAFEHNLPATVPLEAIIKTPGFMTCSLVFALLAMCAAYMANGTALTSFVRDLSTTYLRSSNIWLARAITFIPPLIVAIAFPNVFLDAIGLVGGVGIDVIFGILPGFLLVKYQTGMLKKLGWLLIAIFTIVLIYEIGQELGLLHIHPEAKYWNAKFHTS